VQLSALCRRLRGVEALFDEVELLGRVGHAEVPDHMPRPTCSCFLHLSEGSAVVTYEGAACGRTWHRHAVARLFGRQPGGSRGFGPALPVSIILAERMESIGTPRHFAPHGPAPPAPPRRGGHLDRFTTGR